MSGLISLLARKKTTGKIDQLTLDATINVNYTFTNEITQYPVEDGGTVTDHIKQQPLSLTITGFITNNPIKFIGENVADLITDIRNKRRSDESTEKDLTDADDSNRTAIAFSNLLDISGYRLQEGSKGNQLIQIGEPKKFEVITGLAIYKDMAVKSLKIPRNAQNTESFQFDIELMRIQFVKSETAEIEIDDVSEKKDGADRAKNQAASTKNVGKQSTEEIDPRDLRQRSLLVKLGDKLGDFARKTKGQELLFGR